MDFPKNLLLLTLKRQEKDDYTKIYSYSLNQQWPIRNYKGVYGEANSSQSKYIELLNKF